MTFKKWLEDRDLSMEFYYDLCEAARKDLVYKYFTELYGGDPCGNDTSN